ncbi:MAG: amidohydrolase family protein [Planctomycetota bacterium]
MNPNAKRLCGFLSLLIGFVLLSTETAHSQVKAKTVPVEGLRENPPVSFLLKNATVVVSPDQTLESASVLVRGSSILMVGHNLDAPPGAHVLDCSGQYIYPGFIDAYREVDVEVSEDAKDRYWNGNVLPRRRAETALDNIDNASALREQGIAVQLVAPRGAIVKGQSCLVLLGDEPTVLQPDVAQHLQLTVPRDRRRDAYPNSPMGAIALLRQTFADADWYSRASLAYQADSTLPRPRRDADLEAIASQMDMPFIFDAPNERMAIRAGDLAKEFSIQPILHGSGREYREIEAVSRLGAPVLLPVEFPDAPSVASEAEANDVDLRTLMHWYFAPENPKRLVEVGIPVCFTTDGLEDKGDFLSNIRIAVKRGLSPADALAAITTVPAQVFGSDATLGRVKSGCLANLVITDGDLFSEDTEVLETWVAGQRFLQEPTPDPDFLEGSWATTITAGDSKIDIVMSLESSDGSWKGKIAIPEEESSIGEESKEDGQGGEDQAGEDQAGEEATAELKRIARANDRLTAWVDLADVSDDLPEGPSRLTLVTIETAGSEQIFSSLVFAGGGSTTLTWRASEDADGEEDTESKQTEEDESQEKKELELDAKSALAKVVVNYPLGGYGRLESVANPECILFRGATVWTCGPNGILETADVLVRDGKIIAVDLSIEAPAGCEVIDVTGKHLSPGIIDCHSHMATDGGVNESAQVVTAEVRIGDFVDHTDVNIYRQLAGGVTMANVLHGSANPIGGQNQVIKLLWGDSMHEVKFDPAPSGIKFALGENVKRSNRTGSQTRYPASRLGVEQIIRDRLLAAREYDRDHQRYRAGKRDRLPPRVDYELEALAEILRGERWIHCHSYRQDEIIALLDVLDEFDITIGTLQHILEGYKVADRMKEHGAMASAFADWWAYKFEVYDAIPDNGAIMHDQGIVVSFNSDDRELARHLNTEAAKAVKYGGVPPEAALKFVTLNPAKQLRIDEHVGSIEVGKDADLAIWSGPPLSTLSRCEQTWVDGRPMFSLEQDRALRKRDAGWRAALISHILDEDYAMSEGDHDHLEEEDRWLRYDEFCHDHDHDHDDHRERHNHE